jgi:hypothetical protein
MVRWALGTVLAAILVFGGYATANANSADEGDAVSLVKGGKGKGKGKKKGGKKKGGKRKGGKKHGASA